MAPKNKQAGLYDDYRVLRLKEDNLIKPVSEEENKETSLLHE